MPPRHRFPDHVQLDSSHVPFCWVAAGEAYVCFAQQQRLCSRGPYSEFELVLATLSR